MDKESDRLRSADILYFLKSPAAGRFPKIKYLPLKMRGRTDIEGFRIYRRDA